MADIKIENKKKPLMAGEEISSLAERLQKPESKVIVDQMRVLAEDPSYAPSASPDTRKQLKETLDQARQMYDSQVSRNEWLEVAQNLGRAITSFGAAQQGMKTGRDMSNLSQGPAVDYGSRSERALRERGQSDREATLTEAADRQRFHDTEKQKSGEYGQKHDYLKSALKAALESEQEANKLAKYGQVENAKLSQESRRDKERADQEAARLAKEWRMAEGQDILREEKKEEAKSTLMDALLREDLSDKNKEKVMMRLGPTAAAAGVDLSAAIAQADKVKEDQPGLLKRTFTDAKEKTPEELRAALMKSLGIDTSKLAAISDRKKRLEEARKTGRLPGEQDSGPSKSPPPTDDKVKVVNKDGVVGMIPRSQLSDALTQGYKEVK